MLRACLFGLVTAALLTPTPPSSWTLAAPAPQVAALDAFIARALVDYQVPGAADENTIFQLASLRKTFTGAAAATLVDEDKLAWDTPITTYLPEFVGSDPYMTRWLTMGDLLAHRIGWPEFRGDQRGSSMPENARSPANSRRRPRRDAPLQASAADTAAVIFGIR